MILRKKFFLVLLLLGFILYACKNNYESNLKNKKEVNIGKLLLEIPESFAYVNQGGVDSYVAYIITDKSDTFHIEYGREGVIYDLFEPPPVAFPISNKKDSVDRLEEEAYIVYSKTWQKDNEQNILAKSYFRYDTIANISMKTVHPKRFGKGITGVYIPYVTNENSFSLYGDNLDSLTSQKLNDIIRTIHYRE